MCVRFAIKRSNFPVAISNANWNMFLLIHLSFDDIRFRVGAKKNKFLPWTICKIYSQKCYRLSLKLNSMWGYSSWSREAMGSSCIQIMSVSVCYSWASQWKYAESSCWPFLQRTSAEGKYWKYVKWSCVPHLILSYSMNDLCFNISISDRWYFEMFFFDDMNYEKSPSFSTLLNSLWN